MSEQMREKLQAALRDLCLEATRNPRLYQLCLENPQAALREAGVELPQGIPGVRFVAPGEAVVRLQPLSPEGELSSDDLEDVAGGQYVWQDQWVWVPEGVPLNPVIPVHINPETPIIPSGLQLSTITPITVQTSVIP